MEDQQVIMAPENFKFNFISSLTRYCRRQTRVVQIGDTPLGGEYPIRIQTMTNRSTLDTRSTVEQCMRIAKVGADYIRLTAQNVKEAENLAVIKKMLRSNGVSTPLIADIHFSPKLAEIAAHSLEKVRINPGNFIPSSGPAKKKYSEQEYQSGYEKIAERLFPLIKVCKDHGTALRIGVNHGSLSNRIMDRFGDTPAGMVKSAMEFIDLCVEADFHQLVLSMKSSNTRIMVEAYRILVSKMDEKGYNYPLHLGVTEAGLGEDGRIKSAVGIGTLLNDGIGDTIRVSLTEDPECEIPVARKIVSNYTNRKEHKPIPSITELPEFKVHYGIRNSDSIGNIGGKNDPIVVLDSSNQPLKPEILTRSGHPFDPVQNTWERGDLGPDYIYLGNQPSPDNYPEVAGYILNYNQWKGITDPPKNLYPLLTIGEYLSLENKLKCIQFILIDLPLEKQEVIEKIITERNDFSDTPWPVLVLSTNNINGFAEQRAFILQLISRNCRSPVILLKDYSDEDYETFQLKSSCDLGGFFVDAIGDGIWIKKSIGISLEQVVSTSFGILQSCRARITRPEYISCPSCGRTSFDLQKVTSEIQKATSHLKGIKIGIMGCIVNGPGEMADSDYGYVGSGPGKVTLFKSNKIVKKGVSSERAVDELLDLVKGSGDWKDP